MSQNFSSTGDDSAVESTLAVQNNCQKRTHRRSAAVSLDWGFKRVLNNKEVTDQAISPLFNESTCHPADHIVEQKKQNNEKDCSLVLPDTKSSTKKRTGFHGWFFAESISSLAHLYFGGFHKKKTSTNTGPVVLNVEETMPSSSLCTVTFQPLIDLDAALLTKPADPTVFSGSEKHRRSRSASTILSSNSLASGSTYQNSCYKRGYSLKRKMSVIVEDADVMPAVSFSLPQCNNSSNVTDIEILAGQSTKEASGNETDEIVSKKENTKLDESKDPLKQSNLSTDDVDDILFSTCIEDAAKYNQDVEKMNKQNDLKNIKIKRRWRHVLKGFLTRKSS